MSQTKGPDQASNASYHTAANTWLWRCPAQPCYAPCHTAAAPRYSSPPPAYSSPCSTQCWPAGEEKIYVLESCCTVSLNCQDILYNFLFNLSKHPLITLFAAALIFIFTVAPLHECLILKTINEEGPRTRKIFLIRFLYWQVPWATCWVYDHPQGHLRPRAAAFS